MRFESEVRIKEVEKVDGDYKSFSPIGRTVPFGIYLPETRTEVIETNKDGG